MSFLYLGTKGTSASEYYELIRLPVQPKERVPQSILSIGFPRFPLVRPTNTAAPTQPIGDDRASQVLDALLYIHAAF